MILFPLNLRSNCRLNRRKKWNTAKLLIFWVIFNLFFKLNLISCDFSLWSVNYQCFFVLFLFFIVFALLLMLMFFFTWLFMRFIADRIVLLGKGKCTLDLLLFPLVGDLRILSILMINSREISTHIANRTKEEKLKTPQSWLFLAIFNFVNRNSSDFTLAISGDYFFL